VIITIVNTIILVLQICVFRRLYTTHKIILENDKIVNERIDIIYKRIDKIENK
jgi:hypothetical protein